MAFNFSDGELKSYLSVNVGVSISLFLFVVLPPLIMCIACVVALVTAGEGMSNKIRLLLINIFAAEIYSWLGFAVFYLGWLHRFNSDESDLCKLFLSLVIAGYIQKLTGAGVYAVAVFVFVKYGNDKLKWYIIIPYIVLSWLLAAAAFGEIPYFSEYGVVNLNGFCTTDSDSSLYKGFISMLIAIAPISIIIQFIFGALTVVFIMENEPENNTTMKQTFTKFVGYLIFSSILMFITTGILNLNSIILKEDNSNVASIVAVNYLLPLLYSISAIPTPFVAFFLLKPLRVALKNASRKACPCFKPNQIQPTQC